MADEETEPVFQLVYASAAVGELGEEDLAAILASARANNKPAGITGMLVYHEGSFLQALEGDREVVEALYERIERDPRHTDALVLLRREVESRGFGRWSMGFHRSAGDEPLPGLNDFMRSGFREGGLDHGGEAARKVLLAFREGRWRRTVETGDGDEKRSR